MSGQTVTLATGLTSPLTTEASDTITTEALAAILVMANSANAQTVTVVSGLATTVRLVAA